MYWAKKLLYLLLLTLVIPFDYSPTNVSGGEVREAHIPVFEIPQSLLPMLRDYRKEWTAVSGLKTSMVHWNKKIIIYLNDQIDVYKHNHLMNRSDEDDEDKEFLSYSHGTIILKENYYSNSNNLISADSITIMVKQKDMYDIKMGSWQYIQFNAEGSILVNGSSKNKSVYQNCVQCHLNVSERDYVFSTTYTSARMDDDQVKP